MPKKSKKTTIDKNISIITSFLSKNEIGNQIIFLTVYYPKGIWAHKVSDLINESYATVHRTFLLLENLGVLTSFVEGKSRKYVVSKELLKKEFKPIYDFALNVGLIYFCSNLMKKAAFNYIGDEEFNKELLKITESEKSTINDLSLPQLNQKVVLDTIRDIIKLKN